MKTLSSLFLVLLLSIPAAWAGAVDGKGIWCDRQSLSFGYWFHDGIFDYYGSDDKFRVYHREIRSEIKEIGSDKLNIGSRFLNRKTLELSHYNQQIQCHLVKSRRQLKEILQDIYDENKAESEKAKSENKI